MTGNPSRWVALVVAALVALAWTTPAVAQERYRLNEDGQWQQQTFADPDSPEGQLQTIRKALAEEQADTALELAKKWIKDHAGHALLPEAHLLHGDALVAQQEYFKALFQYEALIRGYPASAQYATAIGREYEIARLFASGVKRKWLGMRILSARGEAEELFIRVQERLPGSELGEQASLALAELYFDRGEMGLATVAYDLFLENYPRSDQRERAMLQLIYAGLATFKGPEFDPTGLLEASQRIQQFQSEFPTSAERLGLADLAIRIDESLAAKQADLARWYERRGERVSAIYLYERLIQEHPATEAARLAERRKAALRGPAHLEKPTASPPPSATAPQPRAEEQP